jgi:hypothetical protein
MNNKNNYRYEIELIDAFCENYLQENDIEFKRELKTSWRTYTDIVIRESNDLIAIEAKLYNFTEVLYQASANLSIYAQSYILYPRRPSKFSIKRLKKYGLGLYIFDKKSQHFQKLLDGDNSRYIIIHRYNIAKKRWNNNKIGRHFSENEIPRNYPEESLHISHLTSDQWQKVPLEEPPSYDPNKKLTEWL